MIAEEWREPHVRIVMATESRRNREAESLGLSTFADTAPLGLFWLGVRVLRVFATLIVIVGIATLFGTFLFTGDVPFTTIHVNEAECGASC